VGEIDSPVLDPGAIAELRKARAAFEKPLLIRQLVEIYQTNAPKRVEQLRGAIASGDTRTVGLAAHTLKSNCAMLGATRLAGLCGALEECGDKAMLAEAPAVLAQVEGELARVLAALVELLAEEPENA
jgi:HPt (histidine-containing phosphotransfer) domain-containing protein